MGHFLDRHSIPVVAAAEVVGLVGLVVGEVVMEIFTNQGRRYNQDNQQLIQQLVNLTTVLSGPSTIEVLV